MKLKTARKLFGLILILSIIFSIVPTNNAKAKVASVALNTNKISMYVGNTKTLKLENAPATVTWSSSNKAIATVNKNGVVTGLKSGKVTITATCKSKKYKATVTVKACRISPKALTITYGSGYQLSVPDTKSKITWTSSDSSIVKVNSNGYVSAYGLGTAIISAKVKSETYKCTITVVSNLTYDDFNYSSENEFGFTNFIDMVYDKGSDWFSYWDVTVPTWEHRGVTIGDTYNDVVNTFGYSEPSEISSDDAYKEVFNTSNMPSTYIEYKYRYNLDDFYKRFYFDANNNLILIVVYI